MSSAVNREMGAAGFTVAASALEGSGTVPGVDAAVFTFAANAATDGCPIS